MIEKRTPQQGEIWKFDPNPNSEDLAQLGHEQKNYRPFLVISTGVKNRLTHVTTCIPITHTDNGFPVHVKLPDSMEVDGFAETEHINSYDFTARHAKYVDQMPEGVFEKIMDMILTSLDR
ncbi:type II toxin-antitoxin system PemK/MazF family toxin [Schleiferilactobacillus harbinensis]|uniref:type II toxin-antitoxin system PemK/MazF family toxin n=1 Tax=Schleiferilactobacillus harbinensis TaxID=304207 RepID=UPI00242C97BD|nr:type II toxin-antitoxin system PemK/MazF family toxin [Schleiferilactobacillus harbinensis]MCI1688597.1 type II toxin-antitoxin system PemK/MazF family toxin [Schleiferilactobacillus harbinensis]MCI1784295.1 type II toxin-antitoxin system PemK/MazF family toxin [Schleiferilactobacillus harbinensis]MCI1851795.1 type II toxin-antitoxin system PemK/MazF family toxin [Schleiferilactobacillus harbinensis]